MPARKKSATPTKAKPAPSQAQAYQHTGATAPARPEIGTQAHFKKSKPPATYRFDSSLAPDLVWDEGNPAREEAEALIAAIQNAGTLEEAKAAAAKLRALSRPFLNWAGKAEKMAFDVPSLPLFVHERLSTKAILETLKGHKRDKQDDFLDNLFGAAERPLHDQILRAYEYQDAWVNRMILGDSLLVMNSLLRYEGMGGQVQMIYIDPPYGVKFGSNFQPFIRKRDVAHNDDDDLTREPEMVQAYRDTWELGLHSYLTYLRERLLLARELLAPTGSVFVQISDENLHHVREVMDEVFGGENAAGVITFRKTSALTSGLIAQNADFLLWYARDRSRVLRRSLFAEKGMDSDLSFYAYVEMPDGTRRRLSADEAGRSQPDGVKLFSVSDLTSSHFYSEGRTPFVFQGRSYTPGSRFWSTSPKGMACLAEAKRIFPSENSLRYVRYLSDFPYQPLTANWTDTGTGQYSESRVYVVQTATKVLQRCLLMTTDPGDLVFDPTCGSGTTAFVAEQWGRRWITCDTSRVPLALARQRLLTGTFDYFELRDEKRGPSGGFVYKRRQNQKGEEVGGIVPHITLKSIANNEPPAEEVLVDRPEIVRGVVRVAGPFAVEATIPAAEGLDAEPETPGVQGERHQTHVERMIEILRRAPVLRLAGNQTLTLRQIRPPAKTMALSAEAVVDKPSLRNLADDADAQPGLERDTEPVAIVFGPENGPVSERLVREAWDEAGLKHYGRLLVIGFGIDSKAREFIEHAGKIGVPAVYLQATMDLQMGDLLKNMRSSQVFSVCGLPDVKVARARGGKGEAARWTVELLGLDTFDPATMEAGHLGGGEVPAWFLDTDYNGMVFRVRQAFFPRTGAWENLKRALRAEFEESVWEHLAGTVSAPFAAGEHGQAAVKVIDPRGNELMVVRRLE